MRKLSRQFRARSLKFCAVIFLCSFFQTSPARPDTIILHDGASYAGQFGGAPGGQITFTDAQGIQYNFPLRDVQSLVFTSTIDIVTLRSGKVYSGNYTGVSPIPFTDTQGVGYQFPLRDVASLVFTRSLNEYRLTQIWNSTSEGRQLPGVSATQEDARADKQGGVPNAQTYVLAANWK